MTRTHRLLRWPGLAAWLFAASTQAFASAPDLTAFSLEQLAGMEVRSASRYAQAAIDAPATVTTVTADDIRTMGYRTLADVLQSMRGLQVINDRNYDRIGARGFALPGDYSTRLLLLVDGARYNDNAYDQASIGNDFNIDLALVDRVEFVPGPGSSVYGPNAFFGVVNVITKRPGDLPAIAAVVGGGTAGFASLAVRGAGDTAGGAKWMTSVSRTVRAGRDLYFPEFDGPDLGDGWSRGLDYERHTNVFGRLESGNWTVTATHGDRLKGVPTASYAQVFNAPSFTRDTRDSLTTEYREALDETGSFAVRVDLGRFEYTGDYTYDYPPITIDRDVTTGTWVIGEMQAIQQFGAHTVVAGAEFRRDLRVTQQNFDVEPRFSYLDSRVSGTIWGMYAQDEMRLGDAWSLSAGVRYDHHSTTGGTTNPRLTAIWKFQPDTAIKAMYGAAYRPPNAYEAYYITDTPGGAKAGPALKAETIRSAELAFEHAPGQGRRLLVTVFRNVVDDLIVSVLDPEDGMTYFTNLSGAVARGAEVEADYAWASGIRLRGSASVQRVTDRETGALVSNSARRTMKLRLTLPLFDDRWRLGVEAIGVGPRPSLLGSAPGFVIANANLTVDRFLPWLDVSGRVTNLFDARWYDPGGPEHAQDLLQRDGREFMAFAHIHF